MFIIVVTSGVTNVRAIQMACTFDFPLLYFPTLDRGVTSLAAGLCLSHSKAHLATFEHLLRQSLIPINLELPACIVRRIKHSF